MKVWDLLETCRVDQQGMKVMGALLVICGINGGCSKPTFSYSSRPGTAVEHFQDVALDPRKDFILGLANMHRLDAPEIQNQVMEALQAKGYRFVPSDQAELWLDVFTMAAGGSRHGNSAGPSGERSGAGGGRSGAGGGRGGRGSRGGGMEGKNQQEGTGSSSRESSAPGGDLTIVVELVERTSTEMVWTGALELPMSKSAAKDQPSYKRVIEAEVRHLLEPLPIRK